MQTDQQPITRTQVTDSSSMFGTGNISASQSITSCFTNYN